MIVGKIDFEVSDMHFYPHLRDLRQDHDISQSAIAAYLEIDQRTYSNYETGKREIPVHHLATLADLYHTSTDYLLGRTSCPEPYPVKKETPR